MRQTWLARVFGVVKGLRLKQRGAEPLRTLLAYTDKRKGSEMNETVGEGNK